MVRDDESLEQTAEALEDLVQLLHLSHEAALRLKQHVPSDNFPTAYKLAKKIRTLEEAMAQLRNQMDPKISHLPVQKASQDVISSSDRL